MTGEDIQIKLKINYPVIMIAVLLAHVFLIELKALNFSSLKDLSQFAPNNAPAPIQLTNIRKVKTHGVQSSRIKANEAVLNNGGPRPSMPMMAKRPPMPTKPAQHKGPMSLSDLAVGKETIAAPKVADRPGTRPTVVPRATITKPREMNAMSLKSKDFKGFGKSFPSGGLAISDMMSAAQKISDAVVSIEVPEGVEPDQLNEYELMFYGFQKRTAQNYINSILSNLDRFQKAHPNYRLPTNGRITMTARVTYDTEGNVQQIKMIRWTHVNELQGLFEDIVKDIDQLHNPPKSLWEKNNEFSMFYTLEIVNG